MAFRRFTLSDGTPVSVYKRRVSRHVRLTVTADDVVKVSIPRWAAYGVGLKFAESRLAWISSQRRPRRELVDGQPIGKAHHLRFQARDGIKKPIGRLRGHEIVVSYPAGMSTDDPAVQAVANRTGIRALRDQAEQLLPRRLADLAAEHGFTYGKLTIKQMRSRWGSCDRHGNIVLNLFLMQLPWEHIDYVILHELTHTKVLRHGPVFWQSMERTLPEAKRLRKDMRDHQPLLQGSAQFVA